MHHSEPRQLPDTYSPFRKILKLIPWILAVIFAALALRGFNQTDITFNDQARHAMNGVALFDMFRDGGLLHPIAYLKAYFGRLPALSMPYHPPVFPAVEALFYAALGIRPATPRIAVAFTVFGSVLSLYYVVLKTQRSVTVSVASVLLFFSLPVSRELASDVMLEFPALLFVLMAITCMIDEPCTAKRAVIAGFFSAVAVWTKQAVFLALVPPVALVFTRRWAAFRAVPIYLFELICAVSVFAYLALMYAAGITGIERWAQIGIAERVQRAFRVYSGAALDQFSWYGTVLLVLLVAVVIVRKQRAREVWSDVHPIYAAWLLASVAVIVAVPAHDARYLFFCYPPVIIICLAVLNRAARTYLPGNLGAWAIVLLACAFAVSSSGSTPLVSGPRAAAEYVVGHGARRALYCGEMNGSFIFSVRQHDSLHRVSVLRGDKLKDNAGSPDIEAFAHEYGINYIVLEQSWVTHRWDVVVAAPPHSMQLERTVPLRIDGQNMGSLHVYRFLYPSLQPRDTLDVPIAVAGHSETVRLDH